MRGGLQVAGDFAGGWGRVCLDEDRATAHSRFGTAQPGGHVGPTVVETAVDDLERALFRDHSHVVLVASNGPTKTDVLRALARRLGGALHVVLLTDPNVGEDDIHRQILSRWGQAAAAEAERTLVRLVDELANRGSALVLLVNDANYMPEGTLRRLGCLASNSRKGLRLGLVVAIEGRHETDSVAALVSTLGFGVEKVVLEEAGTKPEVCMLAQRPRVPPPPSTGKGVANLSGPRAQQACSVVRAFPNGSRPARCAKRATLALGIVLSMFGVYQIAVPAASQEVALELEAGPVEDSDAIESTSPLGPAGLVSGASHEIAFEPEPGPVEESEPTEPPSPAESELEVSPHAVVAGGLGPRSQSTAAEPLVFESRRRMIAVSLNARPWARIEVDGRDVGLTPLGDLPVAPGPHRFRAYLADGRVLERVVSIDSYHDHLSFP